MILAPILVLLLSNIRHGGARDIHRKVEREGGDLCGQAPQEVSSRVARRALLFAPLLSREVHFSVLISASMGRPPGGIEFHWVPAHVRCPIAGYDRRTSLEGPGPRPNSPCVAPMQRPATTESPPSAASWIASVVCVPSWNQTTSAPIPTASLAMLSASAAGRNTSTTSTGTSISSKEVHTCSPRISPPLGLTGMMRYPCDWRYLGMTWAALCSLAEAPTTAIVFVCS